MQNKFEFAETGNSQIPGGWPFSLWIMPADDDLLLNTAWILTLHLHIG